MRKGSAKSGRPDGVAVFNAVWKAYRTLLALSEESNTKVGLCDSDFRILELLHKHGSQPVNVLGAQINLTTGSITTAIDRLESRWLAVRKLHPSDRRVRVVELTSRGRRVIEQASVAHAKFIDDALQGISIEDRRTLLKLLEQIDSNSSADGSTSLK